MQNYWTSVFMLPQKVIKFTEQKCSAFLWTGKDQNANVAWSELTYPKPENGLGIRKIADYNCACILKCLCLRQAFSGLHGSMKIF